MYLDGYGEVQMMDVEQKPMCFSKGETLFLPLGLGRCLVVGDAELKKFGANKLVVRWINVKNEVYEYRD